MKRIEIILLFSGCLLNIQEALSQTSSSLIRKGNQLYKQGEYDKSLSEYERAVKLEPQNAFANFNFGNALFRKEKWEDAEKNFDNVIANSKDNNIRQQAFYNKGVSLSKQKKLEESIEAYKSALRLNSNDEDARINLQKALLELNKKNESQKQNEQKQEQKPKQKEKPKPQQSKLNKKEVERLLRALHQKEQEVQQKMQKNRPRGVTPPEKDW
ncbi:MAG TPA: tetratricopeptide repeat protein [Flavitalea sp.]|nr:tetratricopeptide repeat protein [Flavitalea sp.]